nr:hypothetical protein [Salinivirgaceae bacterium]
MKRILFILLTLLPLAALPQATTTFWTNDCEATTGWTLGNWAVDAYPYTGTNSIATAGGSVYVNNTSYILTSESINISDYSDCKLTFYAEMDTDPGYDGAYIEASIDGATWTKLYNAQLSYPYDGKLPSGNVLGTNLAWYDDFSWKKIVVDLADFEGASDFQFRISFGSDGSTTYNGMNVDDFAIYGYAKTTIHNSDGANQLVFDNSYQYITDPTFSVSSDIAATFNRFMVEINKSPQYSDISHIQEFGIAYNGDSDYAAGTQYTLTCNQLNPTLGFEDNTTYFVRVAASDDNGTSWGKWSNIISFTWKATETSDPQWFQHVDYQLSTGELTGVENSDDEVSYKSSIAVTSTITSTTDDAYDFNNGTWNYDDAAPEIYIGFDNLDGDWESNTAGFRFTNIETPKDAIINNAFMAFSCHYPENPGFGISNSIDVDIYIEDTDDAATFANTATERPSGRSVTSKIDWTFSDVWYDYSYYQSPDLTSLIQATVNRAGWSSGNAIALIMEDGSNFTYRKIRTIDSDPSHAAKLYVEYENTAPGTIISEPMERASFDGALNWGRLYWDAEGTAGTFEVTVQYDNSGTWTDIATYGTSNADLSAYSYATIRLVGTFTPDGSGNAPTLKSWTVTTDDPLANDSDLTLSLNADDLTPCEESTIHYTLSVANNGPDEAVDIEVTYAIPAGLTLVDFETDKGSYASGTWDIDALQYGETAILEVWTSVNSGQGGSTITTNPTVSSLYSNDPDATNNSVELDVTINSNTAPQISAIADQQTTFNTAFSTINFTVNDAETSEDMLTYSAVADNATLIPDANFTFGGTGINRTLDIVPATNQYGSTNVTITVDDGTCATTETFVAQVVRHQYANMDPATMVIGQPDFITTTAVTDASTTPGASSCGISPLGILAVGSQYTSAFQGNDGRVMLWDAVPTTNGAPSDVVLGKSGVTTEESDCTSSLTKAIDGVAFSADGTKLLVSDAGNNRILIWNTIPTTTGQAADVVIGQADFITGTSGCSSTKLNVPKSLVVTPDGRLFVADMGNNRVLVYNSIPTADGASADVVIGQDDFNTNTSGNASNKMNGPWDISISMDGKLLVTDVNNNRVLVFNSAPEQHGASADYVIGQEDFGISSAGLAVNKFNVPIGVTVSPTGILAVAEFVNHRVLIFNQVPQENGASADIVLGQPDFTTNIQYSTDGNPGDDNFENPYTIYFDINDRLFVNGRDMNRVMVFGDEPTDVSDLAIAISTDTDAPCMGNPVAYTINITNNGPEDATNVVVNAALPDGFYYFDHEAERGTYYPAGGNWQVSNLANGETVALTITGTVNYSASGKTIEAYASVRSNNQKESDFSNNSASKSIDVVESNYTPIVSRITDQSNNVGVGTGVINFTVTDENDDAMTVTATSSDQSVVQDVGISLGGSGENRTIEITPEAGVHGVTTITVTVTDGSCTSHESFKASFGNLWIGKTTDWHTLANWGGEIPKAGVDIYIPASPQGGNFPLISNNATVHDIIMDDGAELNANNPVTSTIEGDVTNNGTIEITAGTTELTNNPITISGSGSIQLHHVTFSNAATIAQDMNISGNWTTSGDNTVTHTAGTITFNGSAAQTIANAESFNGLGVDNAAGLTLSGDVNVADSVFLVNGAMNIGTDLTLATDITIVRSVGTFSKAPVFLGTSNLVYRGTVTTSNEVPPSGSVTNLTVDGSAIEVTLNETVTVTNALNLIDGIFTTTGSYLIDHTSAVAANLTGGSSTAFVNGTLTRAISTNTDTYIFPVGNGSAATNYLPVEFVNNSLTGISSLSVSAYAITESDANIDDNLNTTESGGNNYINVVEDGAWNIEPNGVRDAGSYGLRLYFNSAIEAKLTDNQFGLLKRPSGSTSYADWQSFGSTTTIPDAGDAGRTVASGYAERLGLTSFSEFAIANAEWPLPVRLVSFTGKWENQRILLEWETASEQQNDYFVIEKSTDAIDFSELARVDGQGNSNSAVQYRTFDEEIAHHTYYYRLKQVDFNGDEHYEGIVAVNCPVIATQVDVYPVPTSEELNIELYAYMNSSITLSLVNSMGQVVFTDIQNVFPGRQVVTLDVSAIRSGWYVLQIHYADKI